MNLSEKIEGVVFGLAFGDGIAAPSAYNRVGILAPKRAMRMRSLQEFADRNMHTTRPFPYTHAQPGEMLNPSPSDDTEWFAFVVDYFSKGGRSLDAWTELSQKRDNIRARTGTKIALKNLAKGLLPPVSGHDNPHYLDDISLVRAIAVTMMRLNSPNFINDVKKEVQISHSEDGLYCAIAIASLFHSILHGKTKEEAVALAFSNLPKESWSERLITQALQLSFRQSNTFTRATILEAKFIENIYAYPISAPETLGLLLAHFVNSNTPEDLFYSSLLHKRKLDSLPPLAGALAGLFYGPQWIPISAREKSEKLAGVNIPDLKGMTLGHIINQIESCNE